MEETLRPIEMACQSPRSLKLCISHWPRDETMVFTVILVEGISHDHSGIVDAETQRCGGTWNDEAVELASLHVVAPEDGCGIAECADNDMVVIGTANTGEDCTGIGDGRILSSGSSRKPLLEAVDINISENITKAIDGSRNSGVDVHSWEPEGLELLAVVGHAHVVGSVGGSFTHYQSRVVDAKGFGDRKLTITYVCESRAVVAVTYSARGGRIVVSNRYAGVIYTTCERKRLTGNGEVAKRVVGIQKALEGTITRSECSSDRSSVVNAGRHCV